MTVLRNGCPSGEGSLLASHSEAPSHVRYFAESMRRFFGAVVDLLEEEKEEREKKISEMRLDEAEGGSAPASRCGALFPVPAESEPLAGGW